jgi:REP element-mobilizing transposase RayT
MTDYPKLPPRLTRIFGNNPLYFVTFCAHCRRKVLATNSVNAAFLEFGSRAHALHNVAVGRYVIMPDHLHLFVCGPDDFELGRWVGALKQHLAKAVGWSAGFRKPSAWQVGRLRPSDYCAIFSSRVLPVAASLPRRRSDAKAAAKRLRRPQGDGYRRSDSKDQVSDEWTRFFTDSMKFLICVSLRVNLWPAVLGAYSSFESL